MKFLAIVLLTAVSISTSAMTEEELENIFPATSQTPVEVQEKTKKWFKEGCGVNLSWILEIVENGKARLCEQNDSRMIISTRVKLSHLESDFLFSYDLAQKRLDLVYKEVSTWKICNTPFVYEVENKSELCE